MARRFAGDVFTQTLITDRQKSEPVSYLTDYFPKLREVPTGVASKKEGEAKSSFGYVAVPPFIGFKQLEKKTPYAPVEKFGGFKADY